MKFIVLYFEKSLGLESSRQAKNVKRHPLLVLMSF